MIKKIYCFSLFLIWLVFSKTAYPEDTTLTSEDQDYLKDILKNTWVCISDLVDEKSGVPFDNSARPNYTSMSNIGFYLASVCGADYSHLIDQPAAEERIKKILDFLEHLEEWHGFPPSWTQVYQPVSLERIISPVDSANLAAGLLIARQACPSLESRITKLIQKMDWKIFYDQKSNSLKGGYDLKKKKELAFKYHDLGSDLRMAFFLTVATQSAPVDFWNGLHKILEERYELQYLGPGWRSGGLFLQGMTGLFLDERATLMGKSAANMAYAQILHAARKKYSVWGWSACSSTDGSYLGEGKIVDRVVSPHASILAISYYPHQVLKNLREFDRYHMQRAFHSNQGPKDYGFRDALDIQSGKVTERYLMIDQTMIFLSLVNFLHDGILWKTFAKDPIIKQGLELIQDYKSSSVDELKKIYQQRDTLEPEKIIPLNLGIIHPIIKPFAEPSFVQASAKHVSGKVIIDGRLSEWQKAEALEFPQSRTLELGLITSPEDFQAKAYFQWDEEYLYFAIEVVDDELLNHQEAQKIFQEDCIELFIDPLNDGLKWGNVKDFQLGFSPPSNDQAAQMWAWFQSRAPQKSEVQSAVSTFRKEGRAGYRVEAQISWKFLGVQPKAGLVLGVSPAVHDVDHKKDFDTKLNWCYLPDGRLGALKLENAEDE